MACVICEMTLFVPLCVLKEPKRVYIEEGCIEYSKVELAKLPDIGVESSSDENDAFFDVAVIIESDDYGKADRILKNDGIAIFKLGSWGVDRQKNCDAIRSLRDNYEVLMPYTIGFGYEMNLLFASKKYHPLSDMMLQRADFIEGVEYYTPEIHKASFVLPASIKKMLKGIVKN